MKVPFVFTSSFSLFLSFFSLEGPSMRGTKNKNDFVSNSYLTLCLICQLIYNLYFKRVTPLTTKRILPSGPLKAKLIIINYNNDGKKPIYK